MARPRRWLIAAVFGAAVVLAGGGAQASSSALGGRTAPARAAVRPTGAVVFTSGEDGYGIFVVDPNGFGRRRVSAVEERSPAWSPDGRRIAFTAHGAVYIVNADGTARHVLGDEVDIYAGVAWSPDGSRIAYSGGGDRSYVVLAARPELRR